MGTRPRGGPWLLNAIEATRLTGCGGASFPVGRKWRTALAARHRPTVVANAAESEPLSAKDATLLRQRAHLVLDGLVLAAETLGAARALVWMHADDVVARLIVADAVRERRSAGLRDPEVEVVAGPGTYLAGESSAIENALGGGPALPLFRGFGRHAHANTDRPATVVHNVETLARIALLGYSATHAAEPRTPLSVRRTALLTVLGDADRCVLEAAPSTTLESAARAAGWMAAPSAVLLGGFGGAWAHPHRVGRVTVQEAELRRVGSTLGAGIVAPVPASSCGVAETAAIVAYLSDSSARQCGPCLFGLNSLASRLDDLRHGQARRSTLRRIAADLEAVRGRGACGHPEGATRLVASALEVFSADFAAHADGWPCDFAGRTYIPVPRAR
jgi:NADH:ubiquinone oxidoreductase subunit F (NADH-binding)